MQSALRELHSQQDREISVNRDKQNRYVSFTLATVFLAAASFAVVSACTGQQAKAKPNYIFKDPPKPGIVAKIGNMEITEDALIGEDKLDFFDLKKREYELKMERLNKLLADKLIGDEAKAAGMSMDDFIKVNMIYAKRFPESPPARAAYAVARLPLGGLVEIESIAAE